MKKLPDPNQKAARRRLGYFRGNDKPLPSGFFI